MLMAGQSTQQDLQNSSGSQHSVHPAQAPLRPHLMTCAPQSVQPARLTSQRRRVPAGARSAGGQLQVLPGWGLRL